MATLWAKRAKNGGVDLNFDALISKIADALVEAEDARIDITPVDPEKERRKIERDWSMLQMRAKAMNVPLIPEEGDE